MNESNYVKPKKASELLGITIPTLRRLGDKGEIPCIRTNAGRYLFNVSKFISVKNNEPDKIGKKICYARVSGRAQKEDLQNQILLLKTRFPYHEIISDYGSGLNFKRKGLLKLLDLAYKGELQEVVVTYKDRLCRFGFELFEHIFKTQSNASILVLNQVSRTAESELSSDLLSIITVFSSRMYGLRKYKSQIKDDKSLFLKEIQTSNETTDRESSLPI
jgi:predicted site-specific integrase-resolvase